MAVVEEGSADKEIAKFDAVLARTDKNPISPPIASPALLPFDELSPPMFERIVAEVAWRVDGINRIRIYGRSGQDQGGLDLVGRSSNRLHVYQVRRINELTPAMLEKAVEDFANPPPPKGSTIKPDRRFDADRFVLVTGCMVDDTKIEDKLAALQDKYDGDLEIEHYDGGQLSRMLRDRGALVWGIFGEHWAKAFCGHERPSTFTTPDGRALLNDPVEIFELSELRSEAEILEATDPIAAAEKFALLATELDKKKFPTYSREWRARERDARRAGGDNSGAFSVAMAVLIEKYEAGEHISNEASQITALADSLDEVSIDAAKVSDALSKWPEHGYELEPISIALKSIVIQRHQTAGPLIVSITEQIVTDDDPADDCSLLLDVANEALTFLKGVLHTRLECCIADLLVYGGADPEEAFQELIRKAIGGRFSEIIGALIFRRYARALAFAGNPIDAIEYYRRSVLETASADHGGDARDALRAIASLSETIESNTNTIRSSRAIPARMRLLPGSDDAAISALESLLDEKLPEAHRMAHHWVRHERISGSLYDEMVARRRYAEVFVKAEMPTLAIRQFILAGDRKNAIKTASSALEMLDATRYLSDRFPPKVQECAAAVCAKQADLIPDDRVEDMVKSLLKIFNSAPPRTMFGPNLKKYALSAIASLQDRLPVQIAEELMPQMIELVPRQQNHYRHTDDEMIQFFSACMILNSPELSSIAGQALVDCVREGVHNAEHKLYNPKTVNDEILKSVKKLSIEGNEIATRILANWGYATPEVVEAAYAAAKQILSHPVGNEKNSWGVGNNASYGAILMQAVTTSTQPVINDPSFSALENRVVDHLLEWAHDTYDIAGSRSDAISALAVLNVCVNASSRQEICAKLINLYDNPNLSSHDLYEQASLHPLSRFRFDTGSEHLAAEALLAASRFADEEAQAQEIYQRLQLSLMASDLTRTEGFLRGKIVVELNRIIKLPLDILAAHSAVGIRQASAVCWVGQDDRDVKLAAIFAKDLDAGVRRNLARGLNKINSETYVSQLEILKSDPCHTVRAIANGATYL